MHALRSAYDHWRGDLVWAGGSLLIRPDGQCRAAACVDGAKCECYRPDEATLTIKEWYDRVLRWARAERLSARRPATARPPGG